MKKFKVITLGCRTNQYESQAYINQLLKEGFEEVIGDDEADICIVNTCTVTESADKRSLYQIRKAIRDHKPDKLIVTGCLVESAGKKISEISGVNHVVSNPKKEQLLPIVYPEKHWAEFKIETFEAHTRAFVKIQDGCNSYCSYCVIPFVRGRSRSKSTSDIIKEVEGLVQNGYKEIVLTGINIGDFDGNQTPPVRLAELIKRVDEVPGVERIRVSSIDPDEIDEPLIDAIVNGKKTAPSMHIVLQSGSNLTLKRMRRKYTSQDFLDAISRLKKACPKFTFTTDIIVGFPGETEIEFQDTLDIMNEIYFAKVHMFPYSDRPKTRASRMPNKVSDELILKRKQKLLRLAEKNAFKLRNQFVGSTFDVLIESEIEPGVYMGLSENFLPVYINNNKLRTNTVVTTKCVKNSSKGFIGEYQNKRSASTVFA